MSPKESTLKTDHGTIIINDTELSSPNPTLILIHGNSSNSRIFRYILASPIAQTHRIVTFDLPGHGASSDAPLPERTYTMRGYADLTVEIVRTLKLEKVVVLGWSLGGHIGLELIPLLPASVFKGLVIVGTPPSLGKEETGRGFSFADPHLGMAAKEVLTDEEVDSFAKSTAGGEFEGWMLETVKRTDGRTRSIMWGNFAGGVGLDQRKLVEEQEAVLIAVVNGGAEPFINLDYLDEIKWKKIWKGKPIRLEGLGHAPFWEKPEAFVPVLEEFLKDVDTL